MSFNENNYNMIFARNLSHYMNINGITQVELAKRLSVSSASVNYWCNGIKSPRMDKVDAMCKIFNCKRSDLMDEQVMETIAPRLRPDEEQLLSSYNMLNETGKARAREDLVDLAFNPKYTEKENAKLA